MLKLFFPILVLSWLVSGCAALCDLPRKALGSSRRILQLERANAAYHIYNVSLSEAYEAVEAEVAILGYTVFAHDPVQGMIILMDIPGMVNTTEVAVFISEDVLTNSVKIELSSRSTPAKRVVADVLFPNLSLRFSSK